MAAAKTKSKKPAAKTALKAAARPPKPVGSVSRPTKGVRTTSKAKVSTAETRSQTVHLLAFIFTCLCLIFMAIAYYAYS